MGKPKRDDRDTKEFTRRVKKVGKHVVELRKLIQTDKQAKDLDRMTDALTSIERDQKPLPA
jgi:hypothetical protein